jgi:hypothetical protein
MADVDMLHDSDGDVLASLNCGNCGLLLGATGNGPCNTWIRISARCKCGTTTIGEAHPNCPTECGKGGR